MKNHVLGIALCLLLPVLSNAAAAPEHRAASVGSLDRAKDLLVANKPADALQVLAAYHPSHEENSAYHYAYARALVALKRPYDSIEHYRLAYIYAGATAEKERLLIERADIYAAMRYYSEAAVTYDVFLLQFPNSGFRERAELGIAEARARNGEHRDALVHFEKAGTSVRATIGKANALQALGRSAEAQQLYRTLLDHEPKAVNASPETLLSIGDNFRQTNRQSDARVYYESVKDPVLKFRAVLGLGLLAMAEQRYEAAVLSFTAAAESPERTVRREAIMNRADAQIRLGRYDAAQAALEEVRTGYPYGKEYDRAVLLLAQIYRKQNKFVEAVSLLKTLIYRRSPERRALDEIEGMVLESAGRDEAEFARLWKESGRWLLDTNRSPALIRIARLLRHSGKPFIDLCAWLIKYGPEDAKSEGRFLLADFYADLGDTATAASYLRRAKLKGRHDDGARIRVKIQLAGSDWQGAAAELMSLRELRDSDLLRLLDIMPRLKDNRKALAFCEEALKKRTADTATLVRFADVLYDAGSGQRALVHYRAAVAARPELARKDRRTADEVEWAHYRIALIGRGADAAASLKTVAKAPTALGRFATAQLKGAELRGRIE